RRCPHDAFGGHIAAGTRSVLDDEWLPEPLQQRLTHEARDGVGCLACRKGDDDPHRPRRIGLRPRDARYGRQRGGARCQMEKISAGKFHFEPPFTSFDHLVGAGEQRRWHRQGPAPLYDALSGWAGTEKGKMAPPGRLAAIPHPPPSPPLIHPHTPPP